MENKNIEEYEDAMNEQTNETSFEQPFDDDMLEQLYNEQAYEDFFEQAQEDAMIEQAYEDCMIEQAYEDSLEQAQEDAMIEQAAIDAMIDQQLEPDFYFSTPDKQTNQWVAIYKDLTIDISDDINTLDEENIYYYIHKVFIKTSKTGKTAYFKYFVLDRNKNATKLNLGNYLLESVSEEYWTKWKYSNNQVDVERYLSLEQRDETKYLDNNISVYPIDYSFASFLPLSDYNPKNFSFKKLNFLKEKDNYACGDKLNTIKILNSNSKGQNLVLTIFDFEKNITELFKELNTSYSFTDFILTQNLKQAVTYFETIVEDIEKKENESIIKTFNIISSKIESLLEAELQYLPYSIKNNQDSEFNILLNQFNNLQEQIQELIK